MDMRRKDRKMGQGEAYDLLFQSNYGILATVDRDGQPYAIPLNYVVSNNYIYFHCALDGHKLENIALNSKVCFTVVGRTNVVPEQFSTDYESVVVFGTVSRVDEKDEKGKILKGFVQKYSINFVPEGDVYIEKAKDQTVVYKITMDHYTGKKRGYKV
jgi:nitroimidazol reductase NimA-like FMN-containing flavoprotein (pyridoxamine 5'-phosphate oxidase superfamily)